MYLKAILILRRSFTEYLCQLNHVLLFSLMKKHLSAVFSSQVLGYTVSCVCTSAFSAGIIEAAEAEDIMNKLRLLVENNQQVGMCTLPVSPCGSHADFDLLWIRVSWAIFVPRTEELLIILFSHSYRQQSHPLSPPVDLILFWSERIQRLCSLSNNCSVFIKS